MTVTKEDVQRLRERMERGQPLYFEEVCKLREILDEYVRMKEQADFPRHPSV